MLTKTSKLKQFIPYGKQSLDQSDIDAVIAVLKSDFLTQGPVVKEFEDAVSEFVGTKYAVAVSNGTAALHLLMLAFGIKEGDEVITSPNTFLASANAALYVGARPILADINANSYNIDANQTQDKITKNTKCMVPVHFAGLPCNMSEIYKAAKDKGCYVVEDACHALGGHYKGSAVGSCQYSDATVFSFHPVKAIATGEGGMITTNNQDLYEALCELRCHGMTKDPKKLNQNPGPWYYEMQSLGYNYRMTDIQAALGISQLKKLPGFLARRQEIVSQYNEAFKELDWLNCPVQLQDRQSGHHLYVLRIDLAQIGKARSQVMAELKEKGVGTQVHYIPLYHQPYYQQFGFDKADFPNTEAYYEQALSIPLFPKMSDEEVAHVINAIKELAE